MVFMVVKPLFLIVPVIGVDPLGIIEFTFNALITASLAGI